MHHISENLKALRKKQGWTQEEMAKNLGVKRSMIGAYEEGRADPRISFLQLVCDKFSLSLDILINNPLGESGPTPTVDTSGKSLRVLPIVVDSIDDKESATLVPVKAAAGYLNGYGDVEYIESLPSFNLPFPELAMGRTYRLFQIEGESMLPTKPGSYIICSYVQDWSVVKNDQTYVVVSKNDGIVYKRILNNIGDGFFTLKSDNMSFESYQLPISEIVEIWKAEGVTQIGIENERSVSSDINQEFHQLHARLERIEQIVSNG